MQTSTVHVRAQAIKVLRWSASCWTPGSTRRTKAEGLLDKLERADVALLASGDVRSALSDLDEYAQALRPINERRHSTPGGSIFDVDHLLTETWRAHAFLSRPHVFFAEVRSLLDDRGFTGELGVEVASLLDAMRELETGILQAA